MTKVEAIDRLTRAIEAINKMPDSITDVLSIDLTPGESKTSAAVLVSAWVGYEKNETALAEYATEAGLFTRTMVIRGGYDTYDDEYALDPNGTLLHMITNRRENDDEGAEKTAAAV